MRSTALIAALLGAGLAGAAPSVTAAPPAPADTKPVGGIGDSRLPLDISAENTEQFQQERKAVWWGNVETVQGTSRMRTPRLTTYFAPRDPNAPKPAPGAVDSGMGQVQRVEAEGPVYYTTPTQQAKGDHATYVAADDTITMTGNVVLVQGKDVATGDKLVIQQKTGHSTLTSNTGTPHRVRAVLYPNQTQNGAQPGSAPQAATKTPGQP